MERYERALQTSVPLFRLGRKFGEANGELPDDLEDLIIGGLVWMVLSALRNEIDKIGPCSRRCWNSPSPHTWTSRAPQLRSPGPRVGRQAGRASS